MKPLIVVTRRIPARALEAFEPDLEVSANEDDRPFSADDFRHALGNADGILCTVTDHLDAAVLEAAPCRARILANFGVGYNLIDLEAARRQGLVVTNTPGVLTETTADLAVALMLTVARRMGEGERQLRSGGWPGWAPTHLLGQDVSGRTLGIVGLGRIGRAVARRASQGFGMRVLAWSPRGSEAPETTSLGVERVASLERLLSESDFVSLHCLASPATKHLMNAERLGQMKGSAFLINTARGEIVDEEALVAALREGVIAGAGLDVYEHEPQVHPALLGMENVVVLPHLGSATDATRTAMGLRAVENLRMFFSGVEPRDRVV